VVLTIYINIIFNDDEYKYLFLIKLNADMIQTIQKFHIWTSKKLIYAVNEAAMSMRNIIRTVHMWKIESKDHVSCDRRRATVSRSTARLSTITCKC